MGSCLSKLSSKHVRSTRLERRNFKDFTAIESFPSEPSSESVCAPPARLRQALSTHPAPDRLVTSLSSLPNELLLLIAYYFTTTRDVYALLRANTRLANLLPHVLSDMLLRTYNGSRRHTLFSETVQYPESLVSRLESLGIDLNATVCLCDIASLSWCRCAPPLHRAISHSNPQMVATLLQHGASITVRCPSTGDNAVHHAIRTTDLNSRHFCIPQEVDMMILRILLDGGRLETMNTPAARHRDGQTWLNMAVRDCPRGSMTLVLPFLARGLDVNVPDHRLMTPLHVAVRNNKPDVVKMLLRYGAEHRTVDLEGVTPFETACNRLDCELINLFVRHDPGLIWAVVNDRGETAEMCFQRSIHRMMENEDRECENFLRQLDEKTRMLRKLRKLASASRSAG